MCPSRPTQRLWLEGQIDSSSLGFINMNIGTAVFSGCFLCPILHSFFGSSMNSSVKKKDIGLRSSHVTEYWNTTQKTREWCEIIIREWEVIRAEVFSDKISHFIVLHCTSLNLHINDTTWIGANIVCWHHEHTSSMMSELQDMAMTHLERASQWLNNGF